MSVSPNRKRVTNGADEAEAPHFRSVSQLAYVNYGQAKASPTRFTHPPQELANKPLAPFYGTSNADVSYTNTITPPIVHVSPTRSLANTGSSRAHAAAKDKLNTSATMMAAGADSFSHTCTTGSMILNSESRSNYCDHGLSCKRNIHRPQGQTIQPVPFRGESESRKEYVAHTITSVPPIKHENERSLPRLPFRGNSTMRESYTGSPARNR